LGTVPVVATGCLGQGAVVSYFCDFVDFTSDTEPEEVVLPPGVLKSPIIVRYRKGDTIRIRAETANPWREVSGEGFLPAKRRKFMHRLIVYALLLSIVPAVRAAEPPVATVGGRAITRSDVETHVRAKLIELDNQRYEVMREGIDDLIAEEVLKQEAKARGVTVEQLEEVEVVKKVPEPSAEEVKEIYEENKEALDNAPFEMAQPYIVELLKRSGGTSSSDSCATSTRSPLR
jgi:hypothetical protein